MEYEQYVRLAVTLGRKLMNSGAEIYRVEESVTRLLRAYGIEPQVFAIPTCLIISIQTATGAPVSQMCRIPPHGTDIELLERCNALCRRLCQEKPPLEEALALVEQADASYPRFSQRTVLLGHICAAAFFSLFFGGSFPDFFCAAVAGASIGLISLHAHRVIGSNAFFRTVLCAAVASFIALGLTLAGLGKNLESITIGTLMLLTPGIAITNATREIMGEDIISGLYRTAEAMLISTAIALGTALPLLFGRDLWQQSSTPSGYALPALWAFLSCVGFALMFNIQSFGVFFTALSGALGWFVYLVVISLGGSDITATLVASMVIGLYAEIMARVRRFPVTGYLMLGMLPLVPGAGIYYTMRYCVDGQAELFLSSLLHTIAVAAVLSIGAMLVSSVVRSFLPHLQRHTRGKAQ